MIINNLLNSLVSHHESKNSREKRCLMNLIRRSILSNSQLSDSASEARNLKNSKNGKIFIWIFAPKFHLKVVFHPFVLTAENSILNRKLLMIPLATHEVIKFNNVL